MSASLRSSTRSAVGALAVLALAGCGGTGGAPVSPAGGGSWRASIGGERIELEGAPVVCEEVDGDMHLRIGDIRTDNPSRSTGISAVVADAEGEPWVAVAQFTLPDERTLLYSPAKGRGVGVPDTEVTIEGETYSIEGAALLQDPSGTQATTSFTITVTCG